MTLSGLEAKLQSTTQYGRNKEKSNMIAYADDCVVTGASKELLEEIVLPQLTEALVKVGLELSMTKPKITQS